MGVYIYIYIYRDISGVGFRDEVPNDEVPEFMVIVIRCRFRVSDLIIWYLDP